MTHTIPIALLGISGRMGRALMQALEGCTDLSLSGALASTNSVWLGKDVGLVAGSQTLGVTITADVQQAIAGAKVAIDFTLPQVTPINVQACVANDTALVIGTTGHTAEQRAVIEQAAKLIPIVLAPNMSVGVNLLLKLAELAAKALDEGYDIEIYEAHHRNKKDAPSGTALRIGEVVAAARGVTLKEQGDFTRYGDTGARQRGHIGFSVARGGDIVGDHTLLFAGPGERIELSHRAHDRSGFARGALVAARWLQGRKPGLYSMQDVLGL
ncbi:MAG: 4-hydroxy-tetrahydrodipicolinate reductase [Steroidobacteraceae bacterium]